MKHPDWEANCVSESQIEWDNLKKNRRRFWATTNEGRRIDEMSNLDSQREGVGNHFRISSNQTLILLLLIIIDHMYSHLTTHWATFCVWASQHSVGMVCRLFPNAPLPTCAYTKWHAGCPKLQQRGPLSTALCWPRRTAAAALCVTLFLTKWSIGLSLCRATSQLWRSVDGPESTTA